MNYYGLIFKSATLKKELFLSSWKETRVINNLPFIF
jgi:hypothetical protein